MKGDKFYKLSQIVHVEMYKKISTLSDEERSTLYNEYFKLIKTAAYCGHTKAMYDMGQQFENIGYLGIPNPNYNPKKSIYWYSKACEKKHPEACNNLAMLYEKGKGCQADINLALRLYKMSADNGSSVGKKNYKVMIKDTLPGGRYKK